MLGLLGLGMDLLLIELGKEQLRLLAKELPLYLTA